MFKNYLKIAWRNLLRKKMYTAINIFGLSLGIAFCLLVYLYISHERSFDTFHANKNNLFRIEAQFNLENKETAPPKSFFSFFDDQEQDKKQLVMPVILAPELKASFPDIKQVLRLKQGWREIVRYKNQSFREEKVLFADTNFFELFSFPLQHGNPETVLQSLNSVVISQTTAHKYFGKDNPIGKTLELMWQQPVVFTVTGVAADAPANSSIQFDFVLPMQANPSYEANVKNGLNTSSVLTFVELAAGVSPEAFSNKLDRFGRIFFKEVLDFYQERQPGFDASKYHLIISPFADGHYSASSPWGHFTSLKNIYQLACLTVLILLIACLNYLLLTITNTASRVQEVGLRKIIGAPRYQIISQFWIETQLMVSIAVIAGWILAVILLPYFNQLVDSRMAVSLFGSVKILLTLLATAIIVGILAGLYPALLMSGFKPLSIIKKNQTFRVNPAFSRLLVILQYASCITLLIASLVIASQMAYMNEKDLGFDSEQILVIENPGWDDRNKTLAIKTRLQAFAEAEPAISDFTLTGHTYGGGFNTNMETIQGKREAIAVMSVDYNYFDMLDLKIVKGRSFSPEFRADTSRKEKAVVINETLYNLLGEEAQIGEYNTTIRRKIIGVVKNYHYTSLLSPIGPAMHELSPEWGVFYWLRIQPGQVPQTIEKVKAQWNAATGNAPFTYTFLDEDAAKLYESQQRWLKIIHAATLFAVVVACLGLFGLSGIHTLNRTKEIGIRKVLGASTMQLFILLNRDIIRLALISFILAVPVAHYVMQEWLQNFAYRIDLGWELFAIAGAIGAFTALLAVSYHSIKASLTNPANSLRDE